MTKIGIRKIYFWGSRQMFERLVYKDNGKYFCQWYHQMIEVVHASGDAWATSGWKTVEAY